MVHFSLRELAAGEPAALLNKILSVVCILSSTAPPSIAASHPSSSDASSSPSATHRMARRMSSARAGGARCTPGARRGDVRGPAGVVEEERVGGRGGNEGGEGGPCADGRGGVVDASSEPEYDALVLSSPRGLRMHAGPNDRTY